MPYPDLPPLGAVFKHEDGRYVVVVGHPGFDRRISLRNLCTRRLSSVHVACWHASGYAGVAAVHGMTVDERDTWCNEGKLPERVDALISPQRDREVDALARAFYDAYGASAGWRNFAGAPMPTYDDLPENIRGHWRAVATHARARGCK